ncbi:unnamed protein product [Spirodela intermedia]|uniref:Uncharacterized protein n=1 Tax=Spirodela intermedia TaxID=51605 RepID=A0A7I8K9J0_SPIIN|nr:unnamed protein product [Spirodela intermedia]
MGQHSNPSIAGGRDGVSGSNSRRSAASLGHSRTSLFLAAILSTGSTGGRDATKSSTHPRDPS